MNAVDNRFSLKLKVVVCVFKSKTNNKKTLPPQIMKLNCSIQFSFHHSCFSYHSSCTFLRAATWCSGLEELRNIYFLTQGFGVVFFFSSRHKTTRREWSFTSFFQNTKSRSNTDCWIQFVFSQFSRPKSLSEKGKTLQNFTRQFL